MSRSNIRELNFGNKICDQLESLLQNVLKRCDSVTRVVLFGSYARNEQKITSDFDILVLSTSEVSRETRSTLICDFEEANADVVFFTEDQFAQSESMLSIQIRKDGILLWEK